MNSGELFQSSKENEINIDPEWRIKCSFNEKIIYPPFLVLVLSCSRLLIVNL